MNPQSLSAACARVRGRLDEALDGVLPPLEAARDAGHLESCAGCAAESRLRAQWLDALRAALAPERELQVHADARLMVAIHGEAAPKPRVPQRRWATAALVAAAALVVLAALPALPGGASTLQAWTGGSLSGLVPDDLPTLRWNPKTLEPRMGH